MNKQEKAALEARRLFLSEYQGVLSTHSVDVPGYPFGSIVPFCLDHQGRPVIQISKIAQHTKNIVANPKVSLIVSESGVDDAQAHGRVTYLGKAGKVPDVDTDTEQRYFSFFPSARGNYNAHDFDFYYIELTRLRFIGGFGQIYWIDPVLFQRSSPFKPEQERGAVEHMNEDHLDAIQHYCTLDQLELSSDDPPVLAGVDGEGFHIRVGQRIYRHQFEQPVSNSQQLRESLVELARRSA
ncbi:MAG: DUF2470 domain-containing protein [Gammaproteobacteria bacterium]|nr:DUF2470 domain-containing protein [Gammaproteobacteria bacterium]